MKPLDIRDATWSALKSSLRERLQAAYQVWQIFGPGTTRDVAMRAGWDIVSLRPRTTDLYHIGLIEMTDRIGWEGIYRARSQAEWETWSAALYQTPSTQIPLI